MKSPLHKSRLSSLAAVKLARVRGITRYAVVRLTRSEATIGTIISTEPYIAAARKAVINAIRINPPRAAFELFGIDWFGIVSRPCLLLLVRRADLKAEELFRPPSRPKEYFPTDLLALADDDTVAAAAESVKLVLLLWVGRKYL
ncbi:unnamed protein product [Linum trigynum]|uniref:Uncharacterized protein n=1 Tax=Linum trigynum TaxID=586398 RepID=A0AAV2GTV2_9ROSI